jgi:hypothetical protein
MASLTGTVLIVGLAIFSIPGIEAVRPARIAPNTTSFESVYLLIKSPQAARTIVEMVKSALASWTLGTLIMWCKEASG